MRFCNKHNIHLISDEIYAMTVYHTDNQHPGFTSVLSIEPSGIIDPNLVHVMYGLSKVIKPSRKRYRLLTLPRRILLSVGFGLVA